MNLEKILAISGKPGLYALKVQTRTGFVAESMIDGKRITVGMKNNVSLLSEISMYTHTEEKPLVEILQAIAIKENEKPTLSHKADAATLLEYFVQIVPDYDQDRVYPSDIKKVLNWYNILQSKGLISKEIPLKDGASLTAETDVAIAESNAEILPKTVQKDKTKKKS